MLIYLLWNIFKERQYYDIITLYVMPWHRMAWIHQSKLLSKWTVLYSWSALFGFEQCCLGTTIQHQMICHVKQGLYVTLNVDFKKVCLSTWSWPCVTKSWRESLSLMRANESGLAPPTRALQFPKETMNSRKGKTRLEKHELRGNNYVAEIWAINQGALREVVNFKPKDVVH